MNIFKFLKRGSKEKNNTKIIDNLIDEIFEKSEEYSNELGEYPRSLHKLNNDIFYLNSARYELEVTVTRLNQSLEKFYENKYIETSEEKAEESCFANSLGALVTLFENFKLLYVNESVLTRDILNEACNRCADELRKVVDILCDKHEINIYLARSSVTLEDRRNEYKAYLEYINKEIVFNDMMKVSSEVLNASTIIYEHLNNNNFEYAKLTLNYMLDKLVLLKGKIESLSRFKAKVPMEDLCLFKILSSIDNFKELKKKSEVAINLMKLDYKIGQSVNDKIIEKYLDDIYIEVSNVSEEIQILKKSINKVFNP
ncbi:MAG: hypothetical protein E7214_10115 [Clostridium sp.]|nr:hypothetical protein [Clostridium sp.]